MHLRQFHQQYVRGHKTPYDCVHIAFCQPGMVDVEAKGQTFDEAVALLQKKLRHVCPGVDLKALEVCDAENPWNGIITSRAGLAYAQRLKQSGRLTSAHAAG